MISLSATITWLNDPLNWQANNLGPGIPAQVLAHLRFSAVALLIALLLGVPLGLLIGHSGRLRWLVSGANSLRALPTTGLLVLVYTALLPVLSDAPLIATEVVLVLLAVPPILANTYAGVDGVDPAVRDAARGMGMTGREVLFRVEVPNALPLMFSGVRSAVLQIIATATVAAYVGLGGLGRYVFDGLAQRDYAQTVGGAVLVAVLALVLDLLLALAQRYTVSRGVSGRFRRRGAAVPSRPDARSAAVEKLEVATG